MICTEAKKAKVTPGGEGAAGSAGGDEERDDEVPTVVVLRKGDVGEEEYHKYRETMKEKSGLLSNLNLCVYCCSPYDKCAALLCWPCFQVQCSSVTLSTRNCDFVHQDSIYCITHTCIEIIVDCDYTLKTLFYSEHKPVDACRHYCTETPFIVK